MLDLENVRMQTKEKEQFFFGKIEEAFDVIEEEVQRREEQGQNIIFSEGEVSGRGVRSISKEIHEKVIRILGSK